jgi:hypothetical protein
MPGTDILCTTDLTPVSDTALRYAVLVAQRTESRITQLHVLPRNERTPETRTAVEAAMAEQRMRCGAQELATPLLVEDDVLKGVAQETTRGHRLLISGTHGPRGLRQSLFGADMLKLARLSVVPTIVVQESSTLEPPRTIVLPVAAHADIDRLLDAVCSMARAFGAAVHVYQLVRPNEHPSDALLTNKARMLHRLHTEGIPCDDVMEPSTIFSIGFAEPTIRYAERIGAGMIAIMAHASDEYRYIADAEKERMLTNGASIPVLCA